MKNRHLLVLSLTTLSFMAAACDEGDECARNADCNYPCEYCSEGACIANPAMADDVVCGGTTTECKCDDGTACPGADKSSCASTPAGTTKVSFSLKYGDYLNYFTSQAWRTLIPDVPGTSGTGTGEIVIMLCNENDPTCKTPAHVRAVKEDEYTKKQAITAGFGPSITLSDLPAGKWNLMIFEDTPASVQDGRDWHSTTLYCHKDQDDWGCLVSDADRMLISAEDYSAYKSANKDDAATYPKPSSQPIEIKACDNDCSTDLGSLILGHYFEEQMSPDYEPEAAYLAVATAGGIRIVDLETAKVLEGNAANKLDFTLNLGKDAAGNDFKNGFPCGLIDNGDNEIVWVLYTFPDQGGKVPNVAVPFNVKTQQQVGTKHIVFGSYVDANGTKKYGDVNGEACRGIVKDGRMYVMTRADGKPATGHLYYAPSLKDVLDDTADIESKYCFDREESSGSCKSDGGEPAYLNFTDSVAVWHDTVYSLRSALDQNNEPQASGGGICNGEYAQCIFKSKATDEKLEAITDKENVSSYLDGGLYDEPVSSKITSGNVDCRLDPVFMNVPSLTIVEKSDTEAWLFASKCTQVNAYKLTYDSTSGNISEEKLDLDPDTDAYALDTTIYGNYIHDWKLSPDKTTLWGVPSAKSPFAFWVKEGQLNERTSVNRMEFLALDISGDNPVVSTAAQYNRNIDNYAGAGKVMSDLVTPEIDPGIDMSNFYYIQHLLRLTDKLVGNIYEMRPSRPLMAVGSKNLWLGVIGDHASGGTDNKMTLQLFHDLLPYSLKEGKAVLWSNTGDAYFKPYTGGKESTKNYQNRHAGFALDPVNHQFVNTMGMVYISKE